MIVPALQIALASTLWGFSYLFIKLAANAVAPVVMAFWLAIFGTALLIPLLKNSHVVSSLRTFPLHYVALGILSGPLANFLLSAGLQDIDVGIGSVIAKLEAVFVILIAWLVLGEKLSGRQLAWSALALICTPFVVTGELAFFAGPKPPVGSAVAIACSGLSYACCVIVARYLALKGESALTMIFLRVMLGGIFIVPLAFYFGEEISTGMTAPVTGYIFLAAATSVLAFVFFYKGLRLVSAGLAAVIELLTPAMTVLLGVLVLSEKLTVVRFIAMALLCLSVVEVSGTRKMILARSSNEKRL